MPLCGSYCNGYHWEILRKCNLFSQILLVRLLILPIIACMEHSGQNVFIKEILTGGIRLSKRVSATPSGICGIYRFPAFYKET